MNKIEDGIKHFRGMRDWSLHEADKHAADSLARALYTHGASVYESCACYLEFWVDQEAKRLINAQVERDIKFALNSAKAIDMVIGAAFPTLKS